MDREYDETASPSGDSATTVMNTDETSNPDGRPMRNLFVPYTERFSEADQKYEYVTLISWEAQVESAYQLYRRGYDVAVHRHGYGSSCVGPASPFGACVGIELTVAGDLRTVVLISETESQPAN